MQKQGGPDLPRHGHKDGGLARDEGVTEKIFARGTGPGRSPFMAAANQLGGQTGRPFMAAAMS